MDKQRYTRLLAASFITGFVGGPVYALLNGYRGDLVVVAGLINGVTLALAGFLSCLVKQQVLGILTFTVVGALVGPLLAYPFFAAGESLWRFMGPPFVGLMVGGPIWAWGFRHLFLCREQLE